METRLQVLAFIIFHRDKTKQQRDGRGQRGCGGWAREGRVGGGEGSMMGGNEAGVGDCPGETKCVNVESRPYQIVCPAY